MEHRSLARRGLTGLAWQRAQTRTAELGELEVLAPSFVDISGGLREPVPPSMRTGGGAGSSSFELCHFRLMSG